VRDEQVREPELVLQVVQEIQHLRLDRDIERGDGLVQDHDLGIEHESARDRDTLALAAREHVRIAPVVLRAEPHLGEHAAHARAALLGAKLGVHLEWLVQDASHLLARIERAVGILEHDLHLLAQLAPVLACDVGDVDPLDFERARARLLDQRQEARERALAAAGLADHRERTPGIHLERGAAQRLQGGAALEHAAPDLVVALQVLRLEHQGAALARGRSRLTNGDRITHERSPRRSKRPAALTRLPAMAIHGS
jgi:hypothetical protein